MKSQGWKYGTNIFGSDEFTKPVGDITLTITKYQNSYGLGVPGLETPHFRSLKEALDGATEFEEAYKKG